MKTEDLARAQATAARIKEKKRLSLIRSRIRTSGVASSQAQATRWHIPSPLVGDEIDVELDATSKAEPGFVDFICDSENSEEKESFLDRFRDKR
jgi:hypothetical protein